MLWSGPFQKRTSGNARVYIDNGALARTLAPTSTGAHERGRPRLQRRPRTSGTLKPTSTTVHGRGRSRLYQQPSADGGSFAFSSGQVHATRDVGQEEA